MTRKRWGEGMTTVARRGRALRVEEGQWGWPTEPVAWRRVVKDEVGEVSRVHG